MNGPDALTGERRGGRSALPDAGTETSPGTAGGQELPPGAGKIPGTAPPARETRSGGKSPRGAGQPTRLSLSNWSVSLRLAAVVAVASVAGLVFGGLRVADAVRDAGAYGRTAQQAQLGVRVTALAQAMEDERDAYAGSAAYGILASDASADKAGPTVTQPLRQAQAKAASQLEAAEQTTDERAAQARIRAAAIGTAFPASVQAKAAVVVTMINSIPGLRSGLTQSTPTSVITNYSSSVGDLFVLNDEITAASGDDQLSEQVRALSALSRAKDEASQQRAFLYAALTEAAVNDAGGTRRTAPSNNIGLQSLEDAGGLSQFTAAQGLQFADILDFNDAATTAQSAAYTAAVADPRASTAQLIEGFVILNADPRLTFEKVGGENALGLDRASAAATWYADQSAFIGELRQSETQVMSTIVTRSQMLRRDAIRSAILTAVLTVLALLLVLLGTLLVGRTLVNPLRRLQTDALDIATRRLPARVAAAAAATEVPEGPVTVEPIGVQSTDEIGRVARAFDQVHAEAVRLAGNEAQLRGSLSAMFISLSRRSVPLIDRLARMIDAMEQNEDSPDQLANLFSMDHLVTRMRRNSENLLVLAGEEPVRKWTDAVPLADVTRAAAAEIEQYGRVTLSVPPGITVSGQGAADVVHLLAELIENATLFSPQNTQIRVTVMELSTGGVLVEVRDDGVGVSPGRLADMNWRLDHPPDLDVSISRHMGLYAVSHLATRHGIRVKLRPGTPQGLSALVWLPSSLARHEHVPPARVAGPGPSRPSGAPGPAPLGGSRLAAPARPGTGRHRGALAANGERPAANGRSGPQTRPSTVWFAAKRPSSDTPAGSPDERPGGWPPGTAGWPETGPAAPGSRSGYDPGSEPGGQTSAGLPRRVARTSARTDPGTPVLSAPAAGMTGPPPTPYPEGAHYPGAREPEDRYGPEQLPSRRRSPEAARNRLSGFQLGSRDAVQAGPGPRPAPPAEKESTR
ncbi:MAG TPA: nitrate- and nitrite sensing domain-containing protein [Trebonia sp.]